MPRKSVEDRTVISPEGPGFRGHPPPPWLSPQAKTLWRRITSSKPLDWFDAGSLVLLGQYCELAVQADLLMARRRAMPLPVSDEDDVQAARLERRVATHVKMLAVLSAKLRLSVQSVTRSNRGKTDERSGGRHPLLGGNVTTFRHATRTVTPQDEDD